MTGRWLELDEEPAPLAEIEADVAPLPEPTRSDDEGRVIGTPVLYRPPGSILRELVHERCEAALQVMADLSLQDRDVTLRLLDAIQVEPLVVMTGWTSVVSGVSDDGFVELSGQTNWTGEARLWPANGGPERTPLHLILGEETLTLTVRAVTIGPADLEHALGTARQKVDRRLSTLNKACERFNANRHATLRTYLTWHRPLRLRDSGRGFRFRSASPKARCVATRLEQMSAIAH